MPGNREIIREDVVGPSPVSWMWALGHCAKPQVLVCRVGVTVAVAKSSLPRARGGHGQGGMPPPLSCVT